MNAYIAELRFPQTDYSRASTRVLHCVADDVNEAEGVIRDMIRGGKSCRFHISPIVFVLKPATLAIKGDSGWEYKKGEAVLAFGCLFYVLESGERFVSPKCEQKATSRGVFCYFGEEEVEVIWRRV